MDDDERRMHENCREQFKQCNSLHGCFCWTNSVCINAQWLAYVFATCVWVIPAAVSLLQSPSGHYGVSSGWIEDENLHQVIKHFFSTEEVRVYYTPDEVCTVVDTTYSKQQNCVSYVCDYVHDTLCKTTDGRELAKQLMVTSLSFAVLTVVSYLSYHALNCIHWTFTLTPVGCPIISMCTGLLSYFHLRQTMSQYTRISDADGFINVIVVSAVMGLHILLMLQMTWAFWRDSKIAAREELRSIRTHEHRSAASELSIRSDSETRPTSSSLPTRTLTTNTTINNHHLNSPINSHSTSATTAATVVAVQRDDPRFWDGPEKSSDTVRSATAAEWGHANTDVMDRVVRFLFADKTDSVDDGRARVAAAVVVALTSHSTLLQGIISGTEPDRIVNRHSLCQALVNGLKPFVHESASVLNQEASEIVLVWTHSLKSQSLPSVQLPIFAPPTDDAHVAPPPYSPDL